jgi:hypothetical protein
MSTTKRLRSMLREAAAQRPIKQVARQFRASSNQVRQAAKENGGPGSGWNEAVMFLFYPHKCGVVVEWASRPL